MADLTDLLSATRLVIDPATPGTDLAVIAHTHPGLRAQVAAHPNAYPSLLDWLGQYGDDTVRQVVGARRAAPPVPPVPPPPVPPTSTPPVVPSAVGAISTPSTPELGPAHAPMATSPTPSTAPLMPTKGKGIPRWVPIVVGIAVVAAGGITAGVIALTHRGGGADLTPGQFYALVTERLAPIMDDSQAPDPDQIGWPSPNTGITGLADPENPAEYRAMSGTAMSWDSAGTGLQLDAMCDGCSAEVGAVLFPDSDAAVTWASQFGDWASLALGSADWVLDGTKTQSGATIQTWLATKRFDSVIIYRNVITIADWRAGDSGTPERVGDFGPQQRAAIDDRVTKYTRDFTKAVDAAGELRPTDALAPSQFAALGSQILAPSYLHNPLSHASAADVAASYGVPNAAIGKVLADASFCDGRVGNCPFALPSIQIMLLPDAASAEAWAANYPQWINGIMEANPGRWLGTTLAGDSQKSTTVAGPGSLYVYHTQSSNGSVETGQIVVYRNLAAIVWWGSDNSPAEAAQKTIAEFVPMFVQAVDIAATVSGPYEPGTNGNTPAMSPTDTPS